MVELLNYGLYLMKCLQNNDDICGTNCNVTPPIEIVLGMTLNCLARGWDVCSGSSAAGNCSIRATCSEP